MDKKIEAMASLEEVREYVDTVSKERDMLFLRLQNERANVIAWKNIAEDLYRAACGQDRPMNAINKYIKMRDNALSQS